MVAWPTDLPQSFVMDSYREDMPDNLIRDQFDTGPAGLRPRTTAAPYQISGPMRMTVDQWEELKTFYRDTLIQGSQPFTFPEQGCPTTPASLTVRFASPPSRQRYGPKWMVTIQLEVLP